MINPNYSIEFNVLIYPESIGIHKFGGLIAFDSKDNKTYHFPNIYQFTVVN